MSTTEIPEEWKGREVIKASDSPTLARKKEERLAARKAAIVRDVKRGTRPAEDLEKFNEELRREELLAERRQAREDAIDLRAEQLRNEASTAAIDRAARERIEAEAGR
jgi:hypothetical protein